MKLLLYCSNIEPYLLCEPYIDKNKPCRLLRKDIDKTIYNCTKEQAVNGKIVAECDFTVFDIHPCASYKGGLEYGSNCMWATFINEEDLLNKSCLTMEELDKYLASNKSSGYGIGIENLHIFNEPRELSDYEYTHIVKGEPTLRAVLFEAPRGMKKIIANGTDAILLSVRPEELYRILNSEQIIIIKKRVLKEMKK